MDDKNTPLTTPAAQQTTNPPPTPIDLTAPAPEPKTPDQPLVTPPLEPETPIQPPVEHDITPPASLPPVESISAPESNATPADSSVSPEVPSPIPSMPSASSIPPMPSLDSLSTAPSRVSNPAPTTVAAPIPDSVINVSAPATTPSTPPIATESPAPNTESEAPVLAAPTSPVETKPLDSTQPKKSKALVFVVIFLALVALALGSLVVWRALQPETSSIEESMTPPVVMEAEDIEEITEEEVIVEQPVEMIDGNANEDSEFNSATTGAALQGSCTQDGETYADGDEVPAPDSCNSCSCDNGQIACTAMACEE